MPDIHTATDRVRTGHRRRWPAAAALALTLTTAACAAEGAADEPASAPSTTVAPTTTAPTTTTAPPPPERLDVVATEFEWSGLPDRLPPGDYPLTLRNDGVEAHEIQVFRNTEGRTLAELFDLGPVDFAAHVELAGGTIVGASSTSEEIVLHLEEGTYEVVCFIPALADERPHFEHGMHRTLEVG